MLRLGRAGPKPSDFAVHHFFALRPEKSSHPRAPSLQIVPTLGSKVCK